MKNVQMYDQKVMDQAYEYAADLMVNAGRDSYEIQTRLVRKGLDEETAAYVVTDLTTQIREANREAGQKDMLYGTLWCVGGLVATFANIGYIFWGAIVFGGIQFVRGYRRYYG